MRSFHARALPRPLFTDEDFTATRFDTEADKGWSANALCRFIEADFRLTLFPEKLYSRLSSSFGHIAHGNRHGFISEFFEDRRGKIAFLEATLSHPCYGDPAWTYSDVERAIQARLRGGDMLALHRTWHAADIDASERALLARLRAKCDGVPIPPPVTPLTTRPVAPTRSEKSADAINQASLF